MKTTVVISAELFDKLKRRLPAVTREMLFDTYGISQSTWWRLRDGAPVSQVTLDRILARYERLSDCR